MPQASDPVPLELELQSSVSHPTWMLGAELMAFVSHLTSYRTASAGEHNGQQGNEKAIVNIYENKNRTRQNLCCKYSLVSIVESSHSICAQNLGRHPKYTNHSIGDQMVKSKCYLKTEIFAPAGLICYQQFELVDRVSERLISLQAAPPSMTRSGNPAPLAGK